MKYPLAAILLLCSFLLADTAQAETWHFALIGDTPYNDDERREFPKMLDDIAVQQPAFIIHAGDFKKVTHAAPTPCFSIAVRSSMPPGCL